MADFRAIEAACAGILRMLEQSWRPDLTEGESPLFRVYRAPNFADPMETGVSLFLYKVTVNTSPQRLPGRSAPGSAHAPQPLLLDLHVLITPWAQDAVIQQAILGWAMRLLADAPNLPAALLNHSEPGVFDPDETVEVIPAQLSSEELFRIHGLLPGHFSLSVPYLLRGLRVRSLTLENP